MKTALIVLGYILSFWFIVAGALYAIETGERPPLVGMILMLAGGAFIIGHSYYIPKKDK